MAHLDFEKFSMALLSKYCSRTWPKFSNQISLELDWKGFSGRKQVISKKKRSSPKLKRFFRPKTGDFQKKRSLPKFKRFFLAENRWFPEKNANTTFPNQNALWPTTKCSVGHDPQVEKHWLKSYWIIPGKMEWWTSLVNIWSNIVLVVSVTLVGLVIKGKSPQLSIIIR